MINQTARAKRKEMLAQQFEANAAMCVLAGCMDEVYVTEFPNSDGTKEWCPSHNHWRTSND